MPDAWQHQVRAHLTEAAAQLRDDPADPAIAPILASCSATAPPSSANSTPLGCGLASRR